ncbi:Flagellar motor switch protein FliN [hydrothermal vent metagenome]|uniref:Flagellar motor switch protein FliN n=1 Tax=hydrothermal vent metagenome TaxID=652676 RepID=A0A3B0XUV6_9ZZZZ
MSEEDAGDDWASALQEQSDSEGDQQIATSEGDNYKAAEFDKLQDDNAGPLSDEFNLDVILDVPVTLSMEIGRTQVSIRNLLQLNQGSVVELDRLAGEPMDVLVNGTLIAHGEVVVVNEKFGIRLTDVISPAERVKKLK